MCACMVMVTQYKRLSARRLRSTLLPLAIVIECMRRLLRRVCVHLLLGCMHLLLRLLHHQGRQLRRRRGAEGRGLLLLDRGGWEGGLRPLVDLVKPAPVAQPPLEPSPRVIELSVPWVEAQPRLE